MQFEKWYDIDLKKPRQFVPDIGFPTFEGDNNSVRIGVNVFSDKAPSDVAGTIKGYCILPNGVALMPWDGAKDGNRAWIDVPDDALIMNGRITLSIRCFDADETTVLFQASATVRRVDSERHYDPEDEIGDVTDLIEEAERVSGVAAQAAQDAQDALAQASDIVSYATQTGQTDAQKATARTNIEAASEQDVSDLRGALDYSDNVSVINSFTNGKYIATSGTTADITSLVSNSKLKVAVIPCTEGDIFSISGTGSSAARLWAFLQENGTVITKSKASVTESGTLLVTPPESAYLVVNLNTDYDGAVYRGYPMTDKLNDTINSDAIKNEIVFDTFVSGYWVNGDGVTEPVSVYKMSAGFMRAVPGEYYITDQSEGYLRFVCYDKDMRYLGKTTLYTPAHPTIQPVISGTKWVRLTIATQESNPDSVVIRRIDGRDAKLIQHPTVDSGVVVLANATMTAAGAIQTGTTGYHLAVIPHIQGETIYASYNGANACIFKDATGAVMTREAPTSCTPIGTLNPIPTGADIAFVNLKATTTGEGAWYSVILKTGYKKVLVIGDSVTWLDGRTGTKFAGTMKGFQAAIRKAGYLVDSMGYSGRPYAEYTGQAESETDEETFEDSIYKRIVTDQADVTGYDYIILFGGHNDIRLNSEDPAWCPLGTAPTTYEQMSQTFDSTTFYGALSAIIKYCRDNNPTAQIIQWTVTQTESTTRPYLKTKEYRDAEIAMSLFWDIPYVDMFSELNFTPFINYKSDSDTGSTGFHYDSSHPNYIGMERVGNVGLKALKMYD